MTTVLLDPPAFDGAEARLVGEPYRHLFRAARLSVGDPVRVVDGQGRARQARVAAVDRKVGVLTLGEMAPSFEPALHLELLVAAPRPQRADWLVEKATELGAAAVRFLATERSPRLLGGPQIVRLARVARAAVEQCGRARVPEVSGPHPWSALERLLSPLADRFVLDPGASNIDRARPTTQAVALLIGPEGGWTESERRDLGTQGCRGLSLGPRTLRVETAAVAAAALFLLSGAGGGAPSGKL